MAHACEQIETIHKIQMDIKVLDVEQDSILSKVEVDRANISSQISNIEKKIDKLYWWLLGTIGAIAVQAIILLLKK